MITGATRNKVDAIWQKMWEGGITNPLDVITNLTYLMFMRRLDEKELKIEGMELLGEPLDHIFPETYQNDYGETISGREMRWSHFKDKRAEDMYRIVERFAFPFIKTLGDKSAYSPQVSRLCWRRPSLA